MDVLFERTLADGRRLEFLMTGADDPDLSTLQRAEDLDRHQQQVLKGEWSWLRQVHSDRALIVERPGHHAGATGDSLLTTVPNAVLAAQVADCVPIGMVTDDGAFAVVHSGWRGALRGVMESTTRALRSISTTPRVTAVVGPHICAACYEFGPADLDHMRQRFGSTVAGTTSEGSSALDMTAVVVSELERLDVAISMTSDGCTSCSGGYWSHRARQERGRQALVGVVHQP